MKKLRILVIDDHAMEVEYIASILRQAGHLVFAAFDGREGIRLAENMQPDLVLMDIIMPDLNGFQATRELQNNPETGHIPVIVVSSKDEEIDKLWAIKQGARAYLEKGFTKEALLQTIDDVISEQASGRPAGAGGK